MNQGTDPGRLEPFRAYLRVLARVQMGPRCQPKFDPSDIVQQVMLRAVQGMDQFRGHTDAELAGWLRRILATTLANAVRDLGRERRDIGREQSLEAAVERSSVRLEAWLAGPDTSPPERADRNEQLMRLAAALEALPDPQREAVILHHLQGMTLDDVATQLDRTPSAVAGLIKRGMKQLRERLQQA